MARTARADAITTSSGACIIVLIIALTTPSFLPAAVAVELGLVIACLAVGAAFAYRAAQRVR